MKLTHILLDSYWRTTYLAYELEELNFDPEISHWIKNKLEAGEPIYLVSEEELSSI